MNYIYPTMLKKGLELGATAKKYFSNLSCFALRAYLFAEGYGSLHTEAYEG